MGLIGLYAIFKTIRLVFLTGRPDFITGSRLLRRDIRRHLTASVLGVAGFSGFSHIPLFILGAIAAPVHAAAFVAVRALVQPLGIVLRSLDVIDKNIFAAASVRTPDALRTMFWKQIFLYSLFAVGACMGILLFGRPFMGWLYGHLYDDYYGVLLGWTAIFAMMALTFPLETVIVKQGRLTLYNLWRLGAGAAGAVLSVTLIPFWGANGAILACLGGWIISVLSAFLLVRSTLSDGKAIP
jgi:O-antigen/teichoic acid export membrane protein